MNLVHTLTDSQIAELRDALQIRQEDYKKQWQLEPTHYAVRIMRARDALSLLNHPCYDAKPEDYVPCL